MESTAVLPAEIWAEIMGYLLKKSLKALRLSSKHLEGLASPQLFVTAYVAARRGVLRTFQDLTTHATFRHYVKEVAFDSSWIDPDPAYYVAGWPEDKREDLAAVFEEQEQIQKYELQPALYAAFKSLSHVKKVVYADFSLLAGFPGDSVGSRDYPGPEYDGYLLIQRQYSNVSIRSAECCLDQPRSKYCADHKAGFRRHSGGLTYLMRALSKFASTTILELSLGDVTHSSVIHASRRTPSHEPKTTGGVPYSFFSPLAKRLPDGFGRIFAHLRTLDLTICFYHFTKGRASLDCPIVVTAPDTSRLSALLSLADNLEELKLSGEAYTVNLDFAGTIPDKSWTKLRLLQLKNFEATYAELSTFLLRHDLRNFKLDHFNLLSGTWADMILLMSGQPDLKAIIGIVWSQSVLYGFDAFDPCSDLLNKDLFNISDTDSAGSDFGDKSYKDQEELDCGQCHGCNAYCEAEYTSEKLEYSSGSDGWDDEDLTINPRYLHLL